MLASVDKAVFEGLGLFQLQHHVSDLPMQL
jgi:hypothetical protein